MLSVVKEVKGQYDLRQFFSLVYRQQEGYAYVATKQQNDESDWQQHFFQWPSQQEQMMALIESRIETDNIYASPSLFVRKAATKADVLCTHTYWVEFDGRVPTPEELSEKGVPAPSVRVRSSEAGHEHWYWCLTASDTDLSHIESVNSSLSYLLGADTSGWDATQVLRIPQSYNYKYNPPLTTNITQFEPDRLFDQRIFEILPPSPVGTIDRFSEADLVNTMNIIGAYHWTPYELDRIRVTAAQGERSDRMMEVGYICAEKGLSDVEIFSMLHAADQRVQKFKDRKDRVHRLNDIVYKSRLKYPLHRNVDHTGHFGVSDLLAKDIQVEWQIEKLLEDTGLLEIVGPPQVGKTTFAIRVGFNLAMGTPEYCSMKMAQPQKVLMFSQEMGEVPLKVFMEEMAQSMSKEQLTVLNDNFRIYPAPGELFNLMAPATRKEFEQAIINIQPKVVLIDSLGYIGVKLQDDEAVTDFMSWLQDLRNKYRFSVILIHHNRKANGQNKSPNTLDDVYGSRYITAFATAVMFMWKARGETLRVSFPKIRLAPERSPIYLERLQHMDFKAAIGGTQTEYPVDDLVDTPDDDDFGDLDFS